MAAYFYSPEFDVERIAGVEKRIRAAIPDLIRIKQIGEIARKAPERANDADSAVPVLV